MTAMSSGASLRERQRQEREELIMRAAEELFVENGYSDTSIDDIAARVGIAKGTVYLHFASKEDLVIALFHRGMQYFAGMLEGILDEEGTPRQRLEHLIERMLGSMSGPHQRFFSSMMRNPEIMIRLRERQTPHEQFWYEPMQRFSALIDEGKAAGDFDTTIPTPVITTMLFSLLSPRIYERMMDREHISASDLARYVTQLFFAGIVARPAYPAPPERPHRPERPTQSTHQAHHTSGAHQSHQAQPKTQNGVDPA